MGRPHLGAVQGSCMGAPRRHEGVKTPICRMLSRGAVRASKRNDKNHAEKPRAPRCPPTAAAMAMTPLGWARAWG